jgi:hypothetical protein
MVLVAVLGVAMGSIRPGWRIYRNLQIGAKHAALESRWARGVEQARQRRAFWAMRADRDPKAAKMLADWVLVEQERAAWMEQHAAIKQKYRRAALNPWLPVDPDPFETITVLP